jgi:ABC-type nitrate/sulfonate/bicarbonate transport system substrate-binding protein
MKFWQVCLWVGVVAANTGVLLAQTPSLQPIRVVLLYPHLPIVVGQAHGTFTKYGVEVQTETVPASNALRDELASGKADLAHAAADNAVAMVETAGADVVIVLGGEGSVNELVAQPGIHSIGQLRGKTVIVDAPNTAYALQLKKILLSSGLKAGVDYEIKPVGATPLRLAAMLENKNYAASMLGPPTSVQAKTAGFVSLASTKDLIGPYQATGAFVRSAWAKDHADVLVRYLAAYVEAQRWLLSPANKQPVLELLAKQWHLSATEAAETYDLMTKNGWYEEDARFDIDGFKNVLKLRAEVEGQWGGTPPAADKYFDLSYYQRALAKLKP